TDVPPGRASLLDRIRAAFHRRDPDPDDPRADRRPAPQGPAVWAPSGMADVAGLPGPAVGWTGAQGAPGGPGGPSAPGEAGRPAPMVFPPGSGPSFSIGRTQDCDLRISDLSVSRRHAQLDRGEDGWLLSALGSHNGT